MKDKRQRIAMAWPYAVYTDPTFAATVLQAAAASAHANGTLPDIAAIANAYQYSAAAAAAAAGPSYFHSAAGVGGDYGKFQPQHYVGSLPPPPPPPQVVPQSAPQTQSLQQMMKKPFGPFAGHHHHHHHHHHNQFAVSTATTAAVVDAEHNNGHHNAHEADRKTMPILTADNNNKTPPSSSSSSSPTDTSDFTGSATGTSCKCGIVDCVLTTNSKSVVNNTGNGAGSNSGDGMTESIPQDATTDHLSPPPPPSLPSMSFFTTVSAQETGRDDDIRSAECSLAVHKHVYHKEFAKNKLFQPYKPDVTAAKLNM